MTNKAIFKTKLIRILSGFVKHLYLILIAAMVLIPLYVIFVTSIMSEAEAMSPELKLWPNEFSLHGYQEVFAYKSGLGDEIPSVVRGFINTMIIVIPTTVIGTFMAALSAFSFAKLEFKGKGVMFTILLGTMMIPGTISMIPAYVIYSGLNLTDTFFPLIVPGLLGGATTVFFLRQFYYSIPNDLMEAARIDGLSNFGIFIKIMIPLSVPAIISQLVLAFVAGYNDYMGPLIYLESPEKYTLQIALNSFSGTFFKDYAIMMAGAVVSLVPTVVLYIFGQKSFVEGIATSGMKL